MGSRTNFPPMDNAGAQAHDLDQEDAEPYIDRDCWAQDPVDIVDGSLSLGRLSVLWVKDTARKPCP